MYYKNKIELTKNETFVGMRFPLLAHGLRNNIMNTMRSNKHR